MKTSKTKPRTPAPQASPLKPGERFKTIPHEERYIIDLTDAEIEDMNDAISEAGMEIEFGVCRGISPIAFYIFAKFTTPRERIPTITTTRECWQIARTIYKSEELDS